MKFTTVMIVAVSAGCAMATVTERWNPAPSHHHGPPTVNGTRTLAQKDEQKSAGDYLNTATLTSAAGSPTISDTSEVSQTSADYGPAMTAIAGKDVEDGASSVVLAGGLLSGLAALIPSILLF